MQSKWQEVIDTLDGYLQTNPKAGDRAAIEELRDRIHKELEAANSR
jgi:hypothetical protein